MELKFACRSDIGRRMSNDDRILLPGGLRQLGCESARTPAVMAVCDGCGGYAGGDIAARTVLETLAAASPARLAEKDGLAELLQVAQTTVENRQRELPAFSEMKTTIAGCVFADDHTLIFHAGDSRVYRFDGIRLTRMTTDHSVVQDLITAGHMTEEEARRSPRRNIISRCIGRDSRLPDIQYVNEPILSGEIYLVCSDGVWGSLPDPVLKDLLSISCPPSELADILVQRALEAGSRDNLSVALCTPFDDLTDPRL